MRKLWCKIKHGDGWCFYIGPTMIALGVLGMCLPWGSLLG